MIVHVTDGALIERMWPALELLFAKVTPSTNGCYEPVDILHAIQRREQQLWVAWDEATDTLDAAMTTAILRHPRRTACQVKYVAGSNMRRWKDEFVKAVERFARAEGATLLEGFFRPGWARAWPGAATHGVGLVKELA